MSLTFVVQLALEHLTHPSLQPEFADEIVTVLVRHSENDYSLPLAYFYSVRPVLKSPEALELLYGAIARTSVTEAFYLSRKYPGPARQQLFNQLIGSVLASAGGEDVVSRASDLVSLPLDAAEEAWFQDYMTLGDGRKHKKAKDTLIMRKVVTGQLTGSIGEKTVGAQWSMVLQGTKSGMGGRE